MIAESLYQFMNELLANTTSTFERYLFGQIDWSIRMIGITGPRGVGKSTMLLQYIKQHRNEASFLYVAADHCYFANHSLTDLADDFVKEGGSHLFIDEVHKYSGWSSELKQIYDGHPSLKVVFTGSSVLDIYQGEADLSRRAVMYHMQGLSFREYLAIFHNIKAPILTLSDILSGVEPPQQLPHPLPLFRDYLKRGYYPFSGEGGFVQRLQQTVSLTLEVDIPQYADMKVSTARKLKQLLSLIATLAPFKPNAQHLATAIGFSKNNVPDYLVYLEKAGMIGQLRDATGGLRGLGKVEKVYIDNPTLMTVLAGDLTNIGNARETFFYNQMRVNHDILSSKVSDFVVGKYTFEVGGRSKGQKQIANVENGFVVKDDIEYGHNTFVPLWAFGLNY